MINTKRNMTFGPGVRFPEIPSVILGISFPRDLLMERIARRLANRLGNGMITEVERLLNSGLPPERQGACIHWIDGRLSLDEKMSAARKFLDGASG